MLIRKKSRLEWGEPAFTILDVRDRTTYNQGHILGAIPTPIDELVERAVSSLHKSRDIYVYWFKIRDACFYQEGENQARQDSMA